MIAAYELDSWPALPNFQSGRRSVGERCGLAEFPDGFTLSKGPTCDADLPQITLTG